MSIKILGGMLKGISLNVPDGVRVRPTSVLLKRRVFDAHQKLEGSIFVDIFAGSGGMGLEAYSRNASAVLLVEVDRSVYAILKNNVDKCVSSMEKLQGGQQFRPDCFCQNFEQWIYQPDIRKYFERLLSVEALAVSKIVFFIDPPYREHQLYQKIITILRSDERLSFFQQKQLELWIEADPQVGITDKKIKEWGGEIKKMYFQASKFVAITVLR
ncbi:MAG: RsmD family RNA methyltransferase [Oligoflexia bacterium]|nr:RsmD family RNA methyltransferase [Oligoflexia bacterium]